MFFLSPDIVVILRTANIEEWKDKPNTILRNVSKILLWCNIVKDIEWLHVWLYTEI